MLQLHYGSYAPHTNTHIFAYIARYYYILTLSQFGARIPTWRGLMAAEV